MIIICLHTVILYVIIILCKELLRQVTFFFKKIPIIYIQLNSFKYSYLEQIILKRIYLIHRWDPNRINVNDGVTLQDMELLM